MIKKSQIFKMYDGKKYDKAMQYVYKSLIDRRYFISLIKAKPNQQILEVCCGTGLNFRFYSKNSKIYAVDFHPKMLKIAQKRIKDKKIQIKRMDASSLNFRNDQFDATIETLGLCVAPNPKRVFEEMVRVTKSGGLIAVFDMCVSPNPKIALSQELMKPYTTKIGFPEGIICWDPTLNIDELSKNLPVRLIFKKLVEADTPWSRGYFVWKKLE